jgi:Zn-dependent M28 family amino/carboxypeptidase
MRRIFLLVAAAGLAAAQTGSISSERIRAHVKFLSSDLLEGRGVGARGGDLATEYIATQFALAGLQPAGDQNTFFQRVSLVGVETEPNAALTLSKDNVDAHLQWLDDFVGVTGRQQETNEVDGDILFVGHGITAPNFDWDDYKGVDVRGKVLVLFTNEPPSKDPKFFGGDALTYYGRWTFKYEEAIRRGAQAVFILHTTPTAGYSYDVVRSSWGKEDPQVKLSSGESALAFAGWLSQPAAERLAVMAGTTLDAMLAEANQRDFRPRSLGVHLHARVNATIRPIESRNVAALVPGSDPKLKDEAVVFTAHWDHLGIGAPVHGDKIYNGAVDNASGCGVLLELARAWMAQPQKPRRSALFLAVTAEEAGLRGSQFYAAHPIIPDGKLAIDINYDALYPFGRTRDVNVSGAERTTAWPVVQEVARHMGLRITPDAHPEQGDYYRSDHFSFARAGVPAFSVSMGSDFIGKPASFSEKIFQDYVSKNYHQPSDEYREDWDFSGMRQMAQFGMEIGLRVANQTALPTWNVGDEFLPARVKSGVR